LNFIGIRLIHRFVQDRKELRDVILLIGGIGDNETLSLAADHPDFGGVANGNIDNRAMLETFRIFEHKMRVTLSSAHPFAEAPMTTV